MLTAYCWSMRSVPRSLPGLSSIPDFMVASRMLLISSRIKSDSNCLAVSRMVAGVARLASALSAPKDLASAISSWGDDIELLLLIEPKPMSDHLQLGVQRAGRLDGLQNCQQILRRGPQ